MDTGPHGLRAKWCCAEPLLMRWSLHRILENPLRTVWAAFLEPYPKEPYISREVMVTGIVT